MQIACRNRNRNRRHTRSSRDDAAGTLVIESAALLDGKKLRATYQKEVSSNERQDSFKQPVATEEAR